MTVFKPSDLKPQGVDSRKESFRGELDLYDKGYNLEIEHMPTGYKVKFPAYLENFSDAKEMVSAVYEFIVENFSEVGLPAPSENQLVKDVGDYLNSIED